MNKTLGKSSIAALVTALVLALFVVLPALADPAGMPSTNDQNRINGWAHVDQTAVGVGSITLQFIQPRGFYACFEYRTDGDISQMINPVNYNPAITDGLYPFKCLSTAGATHFQTLTASEYVEVRMVFGAESDERFDWTRFDVLQLVPVGNLQPSWTAPGGGGVYSGYYGPPDYLPVSPGVTSVYDGREAGIIKAGLTPDPTSSNYEDEGILAFKVNNVDIASFASQALSYDVQNETGPNPVWVRIRVVGGTTYQFVPTTNPAGWHTVDAAAGQWQLMDSNGNGTGPLMTLSDLAASNPTLVVDRVYLTLGMGNSYNVSPGVGTVGWVDKVMIDLLVYDFVVTPTCSTDCYVDAAIGDDAGPGTADWPFLTIQKGVDTVSAGGTVHVADGTYVEQVVVDGKALTLVGASAAAIIRAPDTVPTCFTTSAAIKPIVCIKNGASVTVDTFTVDGAGKGNANVRFVGVAFSNAGGTVQRCTVKDIRDTPFSGAQHGVAIYAYNTDETSRTVNVWDNTITGFQKNAMALNAGDTTPLVVDVRRNVVTGAGTTTVTAQNGIQVWAALGSGTIDGNTVSGIAYDGSGWVATAILNYAGADLDITNNTMTGCHNCIYNIEGAGQISGNTLTVIKSGGYSWGIVATDPPEAAPSPFGVEEVSQADAQSASVAAIAGVLALDVSGNTVTFSGTDNTGSYGIEADAGYGADDLDVTADNNRVTGFDVGIEIWQCQSGCDTGVFTGVTANGNCLIDNTYGMRSNVSYLTVDGRFNWWGAASGPYHATANPDGTGDDVSDGIDFVPWVTDGCGGTALVQPTLSASTTDALFCTAETTEVVIDLADVADLYGYQFEVSYDPALVSATGAFVNSFFDTANPAIRPWNATCAAGVCRFAVSHVDPQVPVSGSGPLAKITLTGVAPGTFNMAISNDVLSDIDGAALPHSLGAALPLPISVCGYANISGYITMQGRFTGNVDTGTVKMIDQSSAGFGTIGPATFAIADGAYSITGVPYVPGGTSYKIVAEHLLYLDNEDTITVSADLANKNTRLWGGDADNNGNVEINDLSCVGGAFGQSPVISDCAGAGSPDINADGKVNIQDLSITGGNFDKCGAQPWAWQTASPIFCP